MRAYFWALDSVPLVYVSVFTLVPCCLDYYIFVVYFETRKYLASDFFSSFQGLFGHSRSFVILYMLGFLFSISMKNAIGILINITLNL